MHVFNIYVYQLLIHVLESSSNLYICNHDNDGAAVVIGNQGSFYRNKQTALGRNAHQCYIQCFRVSGGCD